MRKFMALLPILFFTSFAYGNDIDEVKSTVEHYANFDNTYNAEGLEEITDESFHFIMHSSGDTETVTTISRNAFLKGIAAKQFGGNNKALEIENIIVKGNIANVYFTHTGKTAGYQHYMSHIKLNGKWKAATTTAQMEMIK